MIPLNKVSEPCQTVTVKMFIHQTIAPMYSDIDKTMNAVV